MPRPTITFACELDRERLTALFADGSVIDDLGTLEARVALMLSDFSAERAAVVQKLNAAQIPVVGIPLMPYEEGYYFTLENASRAGLRYAEWKAWTAQHGLRWEGVGLDIEPPASMYEQLMENPRGLAPMLARRLGASERLRAARTIYVTLIDQIRADGYHVENYQFPLMADERRVGSTLLQRLFGLVDVTTDREVWMLYTSVMRTVGPGLLWIYGREASAIAVGTTGGGPDVPGHPEIPALNWEEFARDLRLATHWSSDIYIHSLEGCVRQGFLPHLLDFDWEAAAAAPEGARMAAALRRVLQGVLWTSAHPWRALAVAAAATWLVRRAFTRR
jgi:hypothetical protein